MEFWTLVALGRLIYTLWNSLRDVWQKIGSRTSSSGNWSSVNTSLLYTWKSSACAPTIQNGRTPNVLSYLNICSRLRFSFHPRNGQTYFFFIHKFSYFLSKLSLFLDFFCYSGSDFNFTLKQYNINSSSIYSLFEMSISCQRKNQLY